MFKFTKTQGPWANFQTHCFKCTQVITVTNARPDPHDCREPRPVTLYADHDEVSEWRTVRKRILDKLETEMNHH